MKPLRPISLACLGPLLLGLALMLGAMAAAPELRDLRGASITFVVGAALGAAFFLPIAAADALPAASVRRLAPHLLHIDRAVSMLGAIALGYILASMRHKVVDDNLAFVAPVLVFFCAVGKIALERVYRRAGSKKGASETRHDSNPLAD